MDTNNQSPLVPGTQLDHYKIIKTLGQGGFGITYLAMDQNENRPVVIKEYFPSDLSIRTAKQTQLSLLTSSKRNDFNEGKARFKREAETLSEFNHPNIVKVQLYFEANGTAYFVMEYVEGQSLEAYQQSLGRPLNESELQTHVFPILKGLSAVHNKKLLHLDIKPDNIIKTQYGEPLLIDFGGARVDTAKASKVISQHSSMVGTAGFSPPEQYTQVAEQTAATDLYAFGMTLYRLIAPKENIPDSQDRQAFVYLQDKPDPLKPIRSIATGYSDELYQVIESCTKLRQIERPQSVEALQSLLSTIDIQTEAPTTPVQEKAESEVAAGSTTSPQDPNAESVNQAKDDQPKQQATTPDPAAQLRQDNKPAVGKKGNTKFILSMVIGGLIAIGLLLNWQQAQEEQAKERLKQQTIAQQEAAAEKAAAEKAAAEKVAAEKVAAEKAAAEKAAAEKAAAEKAAAEKAAAEKVAAEKAAAEKAAAEKVAAEKVAAEKVAAEKAAAEKAAAEKAAAEKAAAEKAAAEKAAAEKAAAEKAAELQAYFEKARRFSDAKNYQEAFKWFQKAAEQGHARAQNHLGYMYQSGKGVRKDLDKAVAWYRKSADQGDGFGQYYLAQMYEYGLGVPQDKAKAIKWYAKSVDNDWNTHMFAEKALKRLRGY